MKTLQLVNSTINDRIRLHYTEDYVLNEEDQRIKERIETAHAMLLDARESDKNVSATMMKRFDISRTQAFRDIRIAKTVFGDLNKSSKDALRYIVTQWAISLFKKAEKVNNFKAMEKALERITKANNLDKEDLDIPDASKIQPPVQLLSVNFNFINSPRFKLVDQATQEGILKMYDDFMKQVRSSPMAEYQDLWQVEKPVEEIE